MHRRTWSSGSRPRAGPAGWDRARSWPRRWRGPYWRRAWACRSVCSRPAGSGCWWWSRRPWPGSSARTCGSVAAPPSGHGGCGASCPRCWICCECRWGRGRRWRPRLPRWGSGPRARWPPNGAPSATRWRWGCRSSTRWPAWWGGCPSPRSPPCALPWTGPAGTGRRWAPRWPASPATPAWPCAGGWARTRPRPGPRSSWWWRCCWSRRCCCSWRPRWWRRWWTRAGSAGRAAQVGTSVPRRPTAAQDSLRSAGRPVAIRRPARRAATRRPAPGSAARRPRPPTGADRQSWSRGAERPRAVEHPATAGRTVGQCVAEWEKVGYCGASSRGPEWRGSSHSATSVRVSPPRKTCCSWHSEATTNTRLTRSTA